MALRINQNISAMQGHYYLQMNELNFNKSIERLSSGLRINRAADDPAGLVISEKYRAQIDGLGQAINNAKDGMGMIQTAEGALDEMTKLLRSMRNLALHAANSGVADTAAIAADQAQITSEIDTLTKISERTQFGSKSLLNGSLGVIGTPSHASVTFISGTTDTKTGVYGVTITTAAAQGYAMSDVRARAYEVKDVNGSSSVSTTGTAAIVFTGTAIGSTYTLTIAAGATLGAIIQSINADTTLQAMGITAAGAGTTGANASFTVSSTNRVGSLTMTAAGTNGACLNALAGISTAGTAIATVALTTTNYATFKLMDAETIQFKDVSTGKTASVSISSGTTLGAAITSINTALTNNGLGVTASFDSTGKIKFLNTAYGDQTAVKIEMLHNQTATSSNLGISALAANTWEHTAQGALIGGTSGSNVVGTINGNIETGSGLVLTSTTGDSKGMQLRVAGDYTGTLGEVTTISSNLTFQVGAFQSQTVTTIINKLAADKLGLTASNATFASVANIDVSVSAQDAIAVLDKAIDELSTIRGNLGTFQKDILESTVRNLGVAKQNMSSSESIIRDADMAQEMLSFSRAQILQQTGMAMLSQANTAPNLIMNLFRG